MNQISGKNGLNIYAVILAGGRGERFWPRSRAGKPKQFTDLTGEGSMLYLTYRRSLLLAPPERIFVVTGAEYREATRECLPDLPEENIVIEPEGRNTAPCIGLAAVVIEKRDPGGIMAIFPADHLIKNTDIFSETMKTAAVLAETGEGLVTVGITPTRPETGYGYLKIGEKVAAGIGKTAYRVDRFVEKPGPGLAQHYLDDGGYLWNAGIFVGKTSVILREISVYLPEMYAGLKEISNVVGKENYRQVLERIYPTFTRVSIDYGIMERAAGVFTVSGEFYWDDVGTWHALERVFGTDDSGNVIKGKVISLNTKNSIIHSGERMVAVIGAEDMIIVETDDITFVCHKKESDKVRELLEELRRLNMEEYL